MTETLLLLTGVAVGVVLALLAVRRRRGDEAPPTRRILFPYVGSHLSLSALDAALRGCILRRFDDPDSALKWLWEFPSSGRQTAA